MYEIQDASLPSPPLPGEVVVAPDPDEAIERLATDLVQHAENCVRKFGDFHLALSGGEGPRLLYRRLMYAPEFRWIPWRRTHLWFATEACVGFDDDASVYRLVNEFIGDHADIPPEQVHPIHAESPTADVEYEARLREHLEWREKGQDRLDFVLLTLGADGSTAGLRPHRPALLEASNRLVAKDAGDVVDGPGVVTMLPPLLNAARFVAVLAAGDEMADGLALAADDGDPATDPHGAPIRAIRPISGELKWYVDVAACARLAT